MSPPTVFSAKDALLDVQLEVWGDESTRGTYVVNVPLHRGNFGPATLRETINLARDMMLGSIANEAARVQLIDDEQMTAITVSQLARLAEKRATEPG